MQSSEDALVREDGGDHLVLWYRTEATRARAVAMFLKAGKEKDALLAVVLPLRELKRLEDSLVNEGFPLDEVMEKGRLALYASEEFLPCETNSCAKLLAALAKLHERAAAQGRPLWIVGRIAPILFERGDLVGALAVERTAEMGLKHARLLCLYDARRLAGVPDGYLQQIDELHTHTLDEGPRGKVELTRTGRPTTRRGAGRAR